jgi:hypothetical protein
MRVSSYMPVRDDFVSPAEWPAGTVQSVASGVGPKPKSRSPAAEVSLMAPQTSAIWT